MLVMSVTGRNIRKILNETGHTDIFKVKVNDLKKTLKFCEIQEEDKWKVNLIKELTNVNQGLMSLVAENQENLLSNEEILEIIEYVSSC